MNRSITKKLEMAARVQEFQRAHPYVDRNQAAVAAQFATRLAQAQALLVAEHAQQAAASAATRQRRDVRRALETRVMRGVARIGAFATRGEAAVADRFSAPPHNSSNAAFLVRASSLLEVARAHHEALTSHGLTRAQLSEFAASLTRFKAATAEAQTTRRQHRETRAKLARAATDLSELLNLLDVFNRARLGGDAGLLSMWVGLRTVGRGAASRVRRGASSEASAPPSVSPTVTRPAVPPAIPPVSAPTNPAPAVGDGGGEPPRKDGFNQAA